jgi:hypothetical protein
MQEKGHPHEWLRYSVYGAGFFHNNHQQPPLGPGPATEGTAFASACYVHSMHDGFLAGFCQRCALYNSEQKSAANEHFTG